MSAISRRELLRIVAAAAALPARPAPAAGAHRPAVAPAVVAETITESFTALPFEAQQLGGLLGERMRINAEGRLLRIDAAACLAPFARRDSAGVFDSAWLGEHAGKFIDAACNALRYRETAGLRPLLEHMAHTLIASQAPDGYLGTYPLAQRWSGWDVWIHKYNLIGLLSYYRLTAHTRALQACRRMGDLLTGTFGDAPGRRDIISAGEHLGMAATCVLEPMCALYRLTGEPRYLEFCQYLVRSYEQPGGPRIVSALLQEGSVYRVANGKAYEMLSNFNGLIDLYRLTGEQRLLDAVLRGWEDIVRHQRYHTGTVSAAEHFQPAGRMLSLQSSNVGEMCATVTWLQLNWRLLRLTGQARFGHEIERTLYNHLLAAQDAGSGNISYYTSWAGRKEFTDALLCCVSSGPRAITLIPQLVWGLQQDALFVNLYTPGRARFQIDAVPIEVRCATAFPAEGEVSLAVSAARPCRFTLRLRVPEWSENFTVRFGTRTLTGEPGQLLDLTRVWSRSSTLDIRMALPTRLISGAPGYPDYAALQRGAQVLALEQAVNPAIPFLHRVSLADASATPVPRSVASPGSWRGRQLYEIDAAVGMPAGADSLRAERRGVRLVPYAELNNGRVWMLRADRARLDPPAVTAFARASLSVVSLALEATAGRAIATDIAEFITDEDPRSFCTINPQDPGLASYLGAPRGQRGDAVWFAVLLVRPAMISRVVFRHGAVGATGGWFDTTKAAPRVEVARTAVPTSANFAVPDIGKARWELLGELPQYPSTSGAMPPQLRDGQAFELRLPQPVEVWAIRVLGRAGGEYASCAELAAY